MRINQPDFRKKQLQVSILANEAFHNMLSLVSPQMIQQQKTEDMPKEDIMSKLECWRMLFYLGFWKKLIFILDSMTSLKLSYTIRDFKNFKIVYLLYYRSDLSDEEIKELIEDKTGKWVGDTLDKNSTLGTL